MFLVRLCPNSYQTWRRHTGIDCTQRERRDVMTSWRNDVIFWQKNAIWSAVTAFLVRLSPNSHQTWIATWSRVTTPKKRRDVMTSWRNDVIIAIFGQKSRFWNTVSVFLATLSRNSHQTWRRHRTIDSTQKGRRDVMTSLRNDVIIAFYAQKWLFGPPRGEFTGNLSAL